jgi:hypothetical protein
LGASRGGGSISKVLQPSSKAKAPSASLTPSERSNGDRALTPSHLDQIRAVIGQAHELLNSVNGAHDAVMAVRQATATEQMLGQALKNCFLLERDQFDLKQQAAEVNLWTQRRAGELIADLEKHPGGRPATTSKSASVSAPARLQDLGIDPHESHRWQRIASVPIADFERHLADSLESRRELTSSGILALANRLLKENAPDVAGRPSGKTATLAAFETAKRSLADLIWLDPFALAAAMDTPRRAKEMQYIERLRLWLDDFEQALVTTGARVSVAHD